MFRKFFRSTCVLSKGGSCRMQRGPCLQTNVAATAAEVAALTKRNGAVFGQDCKPVKVVRGDTWR